MKICDICNRMRPQIEVKPGGGDNPPFAICDECSRGAEVCPGCDTPQIGPWKKTLLMPSSVRICPACQEREHVTMFVRKLPLIRPGGPRMGEPG